MGKETLGMEDQEKYRINVTHFLRDWGSRTSLLVWWWTGHRDSTGTNPVKEVKGGALVKSMAWAWAA